MLNQLQGVYSSLHKHRVKYVTIGGIAAILHGVPRATFDLDILIEATSDNAQRLLDALFETRCRTAKGLGRCPVARARKRRWLLKEWI
jgi:hypothetical protein